MLAKQAIKMTRTTATQPRKLFRSVMDEFEVGHLRNDLLKSMLCIWHHDGRGWLINNSLMEISRHKAKRFRAFSQFPAWRSAVQQSTEPLSHWVRGRQKLKTASRRRTFFELLPLRKSEETAKQIGGKWEPMENHVIKLAGPNHRTH